MRKTILLALAVALVGGMAYANFGALDNVPAATLLVPYIVVDMSQDGTTPDPNGYTTLTVVTNVSSIKQIIHVTVWSADSQPVIDFDEVLSGYDVWSINWRDLLVGNFTAFDTGAKGGFWSDTVADGPPTPWGPTVNIYLNQVPNMPIGDDTDYNYPLTTKACGFPWGDQSGFAAQIVTELGAPLVPWPDQDTDCDPTTQGTGYPDGAEIHNWGGWLKTLTANPLFFYATIDSVFGCNRLFPGDLDYWTKGTDTEGINRYGGHSWLTEWNTLTGMDIYLNSAHNYSESLPTVNIEASNFYNNVGFYSEEIYAATNHVYYRSDREPLPTAWAFYYFQPPFPATTEVVVWKNYDDFETSPDNVLACLPYVYYAFNDDEVWKSSSSQNCPSGTFCLTPEPNVFPFQTQKVPVTTTNFDGLPPGQNGWMLLVFDPTVYDNWGYPVPYTNYYMLETYLFVKYNYAGYSTAVEGTVMANEYWNSDTSMPYFNTYDGFNTIYE